jgi:hypothetical protein
MLADVERKVGDVDCGSIVWDVDCGAHVLQLTYIIKYLEACKNDMKKYIYIYLLNDADCPVSLVREPISTKECWRTRRGELAMWTAGAVCGT